MKNDIKKIAPEDGKKIIQEVKQARKARTQTNVLKPIKRTVYGACVLATALLALAMTIEPFELTKWQQTTSIVVIAITLLPFALAGGAILLTGIAQRVKAAK